MCACVLFKSDCFKSKVTMLSICLLVIITTVGAFVKPAFSKPGHLSSAFDTESVGLETGSKTLGTYFSDPVDNALKGSHRKFLEFPRSQYVDKTLFIKDLLKSEQRVHIITRPREFGKTLALSSVYYFCNYLFKNETELFSGLKIMDRNQILDDLRNHEMNQFAVIWIDFGTVKQTTFEQSMFEIKRSIANAFREHQYVLDGDAVDKKRFQRYQSGEITTHDISSSISYLNSCIKKHTKRPSIILIDNYDMPFHTGYRYNYYDRISEVMMKMYDQSMSKDDNKNMVFKVVLTGVIQTAYSNMLMIPLTTAINAPIFSESFGFTSKEVEELLKHHRSVIHSETLKDRYGGYMIQNQVMINPSSVVNEVFLNKSYHWAETESTELPKKVIVEHGLYPLLAIQQLLEGERVVKNLTSEVYLPDIKNKEALYWSYLVDSGLVTSVKIPSGEAWLTIPNLEARKVIESSIEEYSKTARKKIPDYKEFTDNLAQMKLKEATHFINEYIHLRRAGTYFKRQKREAVLAYAVQMLKGVQNRYGTQMNITETRFGWIIKIAPMDEQLGKAVRVNVMEVNGLEENAYWWARIFCDPYRDAKELESEILIIIQKRIAVSRLVDVCKNFFKNIWSKYRNINKQN